MFAVSDDLQRACRDYRWLLDRGYPTPGSIKLVGDRWRLAAAERLILFRGVASAADSARRSALLAGSIRGRLLLLDAYNQLFALLHYRDGRPVFVSSDGFVRDAGASHGRIPDGGRFDSAMETLAAALAAAGPSRVQAYFDAPVSGSALHARRFLGLLAAAGLSADAAVVRSADFPLKAAPEGCAAATADSAVLDALSESGAAAFDAARFALDRTYGPLDWPDLRSALAEA